VIYFPSEDASGKEWASEELGNMSRDEAMFIWVEYNPDREKSVWDNESVVPVSKLLSQNPSKAYDVPTNKPTVIIADSHGNEFFRLHKLVKADSLKSYIGKVEALSKKADEKLAKNLDKAKAKLKKEDRKGALKELLKNFQQGVIGVESQKESIVLYHEIQDAARTQMEAMSEEGDVKGLKSLAKEMKGTDIEGEVKDAIKINS
jgi:hypothetical protein